MRNALQRTASRRRTTLSPRSWPRQGGMSTLGNVSVLRQAGSASAARGSGS